MTFGIFFCCWRSHRCFRVAAMKKSGDKKVDGASSNSGIIADESVDDVSDVEIDVEIEPMDQKLNRWMSQKLP